MMLALCICLIRAGACNWRSRYYFQQNKFDTDAEVMESGRKDAPKVRPPPYPWSRCAQGLSKVA